MYRLRDIKKIKGVSLIESLISISLALFVLSTFYLVVSSNIMTSTLTDKKVELNDILDDRIDQYIMLETFDDTPSGSIIFSKSATSSPNIEEFTATNSEFGITITKESTTT